MKVSELIDALSTYMANYGDQEVEDSYGNPVMEPENVDGTGEDGVCVLCDKAL